MAEMAGDGGRDPGGASFEPGGNGFEDVGPDPGLPPGDMIRVQVAGSPVVIVRLESGYAALTDRCPHAGGPLSEGRVSAEGVLTCPWHGWGFEAASGLCVQVPGVAAARHEVRLEGGRLEVSLAPVPPTT